ncbi:hypothetical protein C0Q70_09367 [Pomacea canaliculata]|uniref:Uncharacterized protein n=1 Tax=Pomacea canaliculata TaxID=400727 RepID=A0A2T7P9K9_POMCA|nr:hypothetical protein C0Q70_09367 [Pomacea canaliculata]
MRFIKLTIPECIAKTSENNTPSLAGSSLIKVPKETSGQWLPNVGRHEVDIFIMQRPNPLSPNPRLDPHTKSLAAAWEHFLPPRLCYLLSPPGSPGIQMAPARPSHNDSCSAIIGTGS